MKKTIVIAACLALALLFAACGGTPAEQPEETQPSKQATEQTAAPETGESQAQETGEAPADETAQDTPDLNFPENMIPTVLRDAQELFGENTEAMKENQGGQFGGISEKKPSEDVGFEFIAKEGEPAFMPLNTKLDEFEGAQAKGNQAIFIKFKPAMKKLSFTLKSGNEFGLQFDEEGRPNVFTFAEEQLIPVETDLSIQEDMWYNLLMAIDTEGNFRAMIWPDAGADKAARISLAMGERDSGEGYKNGSWKFFIGFDGAASIVLENYAVYTFGGFIE